jgi:uroporphyrinogen decarboxylase
LGKGANLAFGHGGPGEFFLRLVERTADGLVLEGETGVLVKVQFHPHFYHTYSHPIETSQDLKGFELPDPSDPDRYEGFAADARYLKSKGEYVLGSLNGFFSGIHYSLMEYQRTLIALVLEPDLIHEMLERLGNWNLTAASEMVRAGADCIAFCDDLGFKDSLFFSPDMYRTFFKPWHKKLCETVHALGAAVHLHSHGAITPILDDLAECGFDFINPFDPVEGFEIERVLRNYSKRFIVTGGFPTVFWQWEADRQKTYLARLSALGRQYGRLIFMDSGGVPEDVQSTDFERILKVSRRLRGVEQHPGLP